VLCFSIFQLVLFIALGFVYSEIVPLAFITFAFALIMFSIQFPVYFLLGYSKARFIAYLPMTAFIVLIYSMLDSSRILAFAAKQSNIVWLPLLFVGASLVLFVVSYFLFFKLYEKKDI